MTVSEVSICNQALSYLGGNRITSLDDDSTEAQLCKDNYENLRDSVLEAADWSFAIQRFTQVPLVDAPTYGYTAAFQKPATVLRILNDIYSSADESVRVKSWAMEDNKILCDESTIYFRAVCRVTDPAKFSTLFSQALAARIAAELSRPITNKNDKTLWELYSRKLNEAISNDGLQGVNQEIHKGRLITSRFRGGAFNVGSY